MNRAINDRILGCFVGGAVGDALGFAVEFKSYESILTRYGANGITRYNLNLEGIAEISDDTQMSLYTANGLMIGDMRAAYLEWYRTQDYSAEMIVNPQCPISREQRMYSRRAPGMTCLGALEAIERGEPVQNDSKGCGGVMRVAPIGIYGAVRGLDLAETARLACEAARMTHRHPLGWIPAGALACNIQCIIEHAAAGGDPKLPAGMLSKSNDAVRQYIKRIGALDEHLEALSEFERHLENAVNLTDAELPDQRTIRFIGEGWTGDEAYYIAICCIYRHQDSFEDAVVAAVNHSGDSDSTGAVTGNLMGALLGYSAIPDYYKTNLELHDQIAATAADFYVD